MSHFSDSKSAPDSLDSAPEHLIDQFLQRSSLIKDYLARDENQRDQESNEDDPSPIPNSLTVQKPQQRSRLNQMHKVPQAPAISPPSARPVIPRSPVFKQNCSPLRFADALAIPYSHHPAPTQRGPGGGVGKDASVSARGSRWSDADMYPIPPPPMSTALPKAPFKTCYSAPNSPPQSPPPAMTAQHSAGGEEGSIQQLKGHEAEVAMIEATLQAFRSQVISHVDSAIEQLRVDLYRKITVN